MRALAGLIVLLPSVANAAGFYTADVGARAMARGGAFVAAPDSVLAAHYNPAGLALLGEGLHAHVDLSFVDFDATFERRCPCADPDHPNAATFDQDLDSTLSAAGTQSSRTPLLIPFLGFAYGFAPLDLTIALTVHAPTSGRHDWGAPPSSLERSYESSADGFAGRYSAHAVKNVELNGALSVALSPLPRLRVGASALVFMASSEQGQTIWSNFDSIPLAPEETRFDVPILFSLQPSFFFNWAVGASYEVVDGLTIGSSFRGRRSLRGSGKIQAELPRFLRDPATNEALFGARITGEDADVELDMAPIWRTGVQYRMPGLFRAEAAVVFEGWSAHQEIVLKPKDVVIDVMGTTTELPTITIDRRWNDAWSFRFGGELELLEPHVRLIGGYFYETSAIPDERLSIARIDRPKHGISVGAARSFFGVNVQVGVAFVHLVEADIDDSSVSIVAPFPAPVGSDELVTTVGNGRIQSNFLIASLSLGYRL